MTIGGRSTAGEPGTTLTWYSTARREPVVLIALLSLSLALSYVLEWRGRLAAEDRAERLALALADQSARLAATTERAADLAVRIERARYERDRYRAWARAQDITTRDGWEAAAGAMMRWSEAVDTDAADTLP